MKTGWGLLVCWLAFHVSLSVGASQSTAVVAGGLVGLRSYMVLDWCLRLCKCIRLYMFHVTGKVQCVMTAMPASTLTASWRHTYSPDNMQRCPATHALQQISGTTHAVTHATRSSSVHVVFHPTHKANNESRYNSLTTARVHASEEHIVHVALVTIKQRHTTVGTHLATVKRQNVHPSHEPHAR